MSKRKISPDKKKIIDPVEEAFRNLPMPRVPGAQTSDELSGLFNTLVRMGENYNDRDQRDRLYFEQRAEGERQLEALAVELDYNKKFWNEHGYYPRGRDRYPGPEPEKSKTTLVKPLKSGRSLRTK